MIPASNPTQTATGARCSDCGRKTVVTGICSVCNSGAMPPKKEIVASGPLSVKSVRSEDDSPVTQRVAELASTALFLPVQHSAPQPEITAKSRSGGAQVRGRVIVVRQGSNEPMDFDPWRWIAIPVWALLLLISPLVIGITVWQLAGFLAAFGVAVCLVVVLRFVFSNRLIQSWHLAAALNGHHITEAMPVTMLRVRLMDQREVQLRLKGQISGGTVIEGDRIGASGSWRGGVFSVRRIDCERTGAIIIPRQPNARGLALVGLGLLLGGGLWLCGVGFPWAIGEMQSFQASLGQRLPNFQQH